MKKKMFSELTSGLNLAKSIEINQDVYDLKRIGKDIITLSLGEAFFTLPHIPFSYDNFEAGFHYTDTQGIPELRQKIAKYYKRQYDASINADQLIVSAGSKPLTWFAMATLLNEGDDLVMHEPAWLSYAEQGKIVKANVVSVPYFESVFEIEKYVTSRTKLLILNNPNNPSGVLYSGSQLEFIYRYCKENNIIVMIDEAYSDFVPKGQFVSLANIDSNLDSGIVVNSLSKNFGMSGFRLGYAITNNT